MRNAVTLAMVTALFGAAGCRTTQTPTARQGGATTKRVTPCLMFQDGRAEEAMNRYIEVFGEARVISIKRFGPNSVGADEASVEQGVFEIYGQRIMLTESPPIHSFGFTPASLAKSTCPANACTYRSPGPFGIPRWKEAMLLKV